MEIYSKIQIKCRPRYCQAASQLKTAVIMNYFFDEDYNLGGGRVVAVVGSFGTDKVGPFTYDDNNIIVIISTE
jgi:hypothetical protein